MTPYGAVSATLPHFGRSQSTSPPVLCFAARAQAVGADAFLRAAAARQRHVRAVVRTAPHRLWTSVCRAPPTQQWRPQRCSDRGPATRARTDRSAYSASWWCVQSAVPRTAHADCLGAGARTACICACELWPAAFAAAGLASPQRAVIPNGCTRAVHQERTAITSLQVLGVYSQHCAAACRQREY